MCEKDTTYKTYRHCKNKMDLEVMLGVSNGLQQGSVAGPSADICKG